MRGRRLAVVLSVSCVLVLEACSTLIDSSGLTGRDAPTNDATDAPSTETGGNDGNVTPLDGATDGASDDASTLWPACTTGDFFEDFDGNSTMPWNKVVNGPATIEVDTVKPKTGTYSLHASKLATTTQAQAVLVFDPPDGISTRSCSFDIFVDRRAGSSGLELFKHFFSGTLQDASTAEYTPLSISMSPRSTMSETYLSDATGYLADEVHLDKLDGANRRWLHVDTYADAERSIVSIDGTVYTKKPIYRPANAQLGEHMVLGMNYEGADNEWEIFVDNICCRSKL